MRFFARRIGFYLATAWLALTLNFIIPRLMPGDPVREMFAQDSLGPRFWRRHRWRGGTTSTSLTA